MKARHVLAKLATVGIVAIAAALGSPALAGNYPERPVMIVTPSGAGAGPDVITRIIADRLSHEWGRQVLVVNRPGGGGLMAAQAVSAAERDGYTLYLPLSSTFVVLPETQTKLPLDLRRDIVPIGLIGEQPMVIAVHPSLGVNSLTELIAVAKKRPGQLLYGAGRGSMPHLAGALFAHRAGIELGFIPYPTASRALTDAIGGTLSLGTPCIALARLECDLTSEGFCTLSVIRCARPRGWIIGQFQHRQSVVQIGEGPTC